MSRTFGAKISFSAELEAIESLIIVRLPKKATDRLPSRGQVAAHGTADGHDYETVIEPDGAKGHWLRVDRGLQRSAEVESGDRVTFELEVSAQWPEPDVPDDLRAALTSAPQGIQDVWDDVTSMARWEWVRWVNATANPDTRQRRVEATIAKLQSGKRRPCCFDLSACTDPTVSKNGKLRDE